MEIKVMREYLIDDPDYEPDRTGRRIQLRLFEVKAGEQTFYVSADQKPPMEDCKQVQLFKEDGTGGPRIPVSGYLRLLEARDAHRATQMVAEQDAARAQQETARAKQADRLAWHQSVAEQRAATQAERARRKRVMLQAKILRLEGELAAARVELEMLTLPEL